MAFKFVHAADIHLDSPLRGLDRYEGAPAERLRGATRRAFQNLVRLCLDEKAAFLVLAGDLYDGDWPDYNTGLFFVSQIARLREAGIHVYITRGNHDARSKLTSSLRLPEGVHDLSTARAETKVLDDIGVAVHGRGYAKAVTTEDLSASYPKALRDYFNVGILHTCADGREGHEPYAPCRVDTLATKGYDYWALGHVHAREVLSKEPWVVFPGNLQGRNAREVGPKGATLVTVDDGGTTAEHRAVDDIRWIRCDVDAATAASADDVVDLVRLELERVANDTSDRMLAARVQIRGATRAHAALARDGEKYRQEIRSAANDVGDVWVEKVKWMTRTPVELDGLLDRDDPIGGLLRSLRSLRDDPVALAGLTRHFADLQRKLPNEYHQLDDALRFSEPEGLREVLDDVRELLLPQLLAGVQEP